MDIQKFKSYVGYNKYFDFLIDEQFYIEQLNSFITSSDQDSEHYKWAGYQYILRDWDDTKWPVLVEIITNDPNENLFKGVISHLIEIEAIDFLELRDCNCLKITQFKKVQQLLESGTNTEGWY